MPRLFGGDYSIDQLKQLTGTMQQIAGIRLYELTDGKARGMRAAEVYTGSGFRFTVLLDRAMDIWSAEMGGRPIAWQNPALGGPDQYEPEGFGWGRTWGGGLVTTCGLTFFGQPEQDGPEMLGLHGRISHIPAARVKVIEEWRGDQYLLELEGEVRQAVLGGENLLLKRRIYTKLGLSSVIIEDTVRNESARPNPHMILYHCNFGFPVVSPDSELLIADETVMPRDDRARKGFSIHTQFDQPQDEYPEQVFFHKPKVDQDGYSAAAIANKALGFGAYLRYRAAELPYFGQWKNMVKGEYVCALEPANRWETARQKLRAEGRLPILEPGEEVQYRVEIGALPNSASIELFENRLNATDGA